MLKALELAGELSIIQVQPQVRLSAAEILYKPDFLIQDLKINERVYVEYKGYETPEWRIKRRLWMAYGPGKLRIYKGSGLRLVMTEELQGGML
jgi:predicted nuclease of restriction endonuclease-like RecB superfamily